MLDCERICIDILVSLLNKPPFVSQLPLLKALIDRLLQEGTEELLQMLGPSSKTKGNVETHSSNVIAEYTVCKLSC